MKWTFGSIKDIQTATAYTAVTGLYPASTSDDVRVPARHPVHRWHPDRTDHDHAGVLDRRDLLMPAEFQPQGRARDEQQRVLLRAGRPHLEADHQGINISGSFSAQYDGTAFRDAFLADTPSRCCSA